MTTSLVDLKVIDADTHIIEPTDLWTSRVSTKKWGDLVPHVRWDPNTETDSWFVGDKAIFKCGVPSMAGYDDYAPKHPPRHADIDRHHADPALRLETMDQYGIHAQVLYPNVGIFAAAEYLGTDVDPAFALDCVKAYNDFLTEWRSVAPDRYLAMMTLPFWDLDETVKEMRRCRDDGHKGVVLSSRPEHFGLPVIDDPHWDRLWAEAQELELPINFHIGSGKIPEYGYPGNGLHANYAFMSTMLFMGNSYAITAMLVGGVCHRFPRLNVVSVESGIGWIPYLVEALDWQWINSGVREEHPEMDLLPSEYFKRQMYGCYWFERESADAAIEVLGPDNFLFETDFPHPTSMSPGPKSTALPPLEYFEKYHGHLPDATKRKLLHDNAARVYHLD
jgi:predicted TIM-barrel fold metal-dependent hydrolase